MKNHMTNILQCMDRRIFEDILLHSGDGIMITNAQNNIVWANDTFLNMMGYKFEEVINESPSMFSASTIDPSDEFYQKMYHAINTTGTWSGETKDRRKDGSVIHIRSTVNTIMDAAITDSPNKQRNPNIAYYVSIIRDNTEIKEYEDQLQEMAFRDSLTGLYNRRYLMEQLDIQSATAKRLSIPLATILIDLDDFSEINNTYGHEIGDELLKQFTLRLSKTFQRETDIIARLGGDEFVVLLTAMNDNMTPKQVCTSVCDKLLRSFAQPYKLGDVKLKVTASIGVAICSKNMDDCTDSILVKADDSMYDAKNTGKNSYNIREL